MKLELAFKPLSRSEMKNLLGGDPGDQDLVLCEYCIDHPYYNNPNYSCKPWPCDDKDPIDDE